MAQKIRLDPENVHPRVKGGVDRVMAVQRPVVLAHIRSIRSRRPDATPEQVVRILERRYLAAVTVGGAAVGASAAIPAVGTGTALVLSGVETAGFLEASALYAQSVSEIHGIAVDDPERARTLVMALILGNAGQELITQFAGQAAGKGTRNAYWGELITSSLPNAAFSQIAVRIRNAFIRRFAVTQGTSVVGRLIPFGIGAVVGGGGNHLMGRNIVRSSKEAFGPAPVAFPLTLDASPKPPNAPREARALKSPRAPRLPRGSRSSRRALPAPESRPAPAPPSPDDRQPD
ncbi:MAG: hypothetical protein ABIQ01_13600 [Pseudolysinimonas sp.]